MNMNMRNTPNRHRVGDLRPSQFLHTYGVGAVVDLPQISVMVMGLDEWQTANALPLNEERLLGAVRKRLGPQVKHLLQPPFPPEGAGWSSNPFDSNNYIGVPVAPFPGWVLCPQCRLLAELKSGLFQLKTLPFRPEKTRFIHALCKGATAPPPVLPARFLVACETGHFDDFPWNYFVHGGNAPCSGPLKMSEWGISGTPADIQVRCENCGASKSMAQAVGPDAKDHMPKCRARHPHLRSFDDKCDEQMRTITLGASNSWFSDTLSALSIPTASSTLARLVESHWTIFDAAVSREALKAVLSVVRATGAVSGLADFTEEQVWAQVESKRSLQNGQQEEEGELDLLGPEYQILVAANPADNTDDFRLRTVPAPIGYERSFAKVVLVERLREVSALVGFTRVESPEDTDSEADGGPRRAPLGRNRPEWVPATEVRGEGIFIQFDESTIERWMAGNQRLASHDSECFEAHRRWGRARNHPDPDARYRGLRYMLLHSFSHALMRQLCVECGYTAASVRERIYCKGPEEEGGPAAGILIYTAAPDSEGTLGGLVSLGEPALLGRHVAQALEQMELCASDPLCSEHNPLSETPSALHWAACHACLFAPETSCERGNRYLDRSLLVPTLKECLMAYFQQS